MDDINTMSTFGTNVAQSLAGAANAQHLAKVDRDRKVTVKPTPITGHAADEVITSPEALARAGETDPDGKAKDQPHEHPDRRKPSSARGDAAGTGPEVVHLDLQG